MPIARTGTASATYLVSVPSTAAENAPILLKITGSMSASTTQPITRPHARQATGRRQMLMTITATATNIPIQMSAKGGAAKAYDPPGTASHCHGPPSAPGTKESFSSPDTNVPTAPAEFGAPGCVVDVCKDCASTTR